MYTDKLDHSAVAPIAKKHKKTLQAHQDERIDHYYWMRDDARENQHVLNHLAAENNYCDQVLAPTKALQKCGYHVGYL